MELLIGVRGFSCLVLHRSGRGIGCGSCRNQIGYSTCIGRPSHLAFPTCAEPLLLRLHNDDDSGLIGPRSCLCRLAATRVDSTEQRGTAYATRLVSSKGRGLRQLRLLTRRGLLLYRRLSVVIPSSTSCRPLVPSTVATTSQVVPARRS
jgi:hypothetical protein